MPVASVLITLDVVDGPVLKLTLPTVWSVAMTWSDDEDVDEVSRSDLIYPVVPLCLTLDHPFDSCSSTSTLVPFASVLTMLAEVDALARKLTEPTVLSVVPAPDDEPEDAPDSESKSDLIYPSVPLCLTFDHPLDSFANTSTLVLAASVLIMLDVVDGPDLMLTDPVVLSVPIA